MSCESFHGEIRAMERGVVDLAVRVRDRVAPSVEAPVQSGVDAGQRPAPIE